MPEWLTDHQAYREFGLVPPEKRKSQPFLGVGPRPRPKCSTGTTRMALPMAVVLTPPPTPATLPARGPLRPDHLIPVPQLEWHEPRASQHAPPLWELYSFTWDS